MRPDGQRRRTGRTELGNLDSGTISGGVKKVTEILALERPPDIRPEGGGFVRVLAGSGPGDGSPVSLGKVFLPLGTFKMHGYINGTADENIMSLYVVTADGGVGFDIITPGTAWGTSADHLVFFESTSLIRVTTAGVMDIKGVATTADPASVDYSGFIEFIPVAEAPLF